MALTTSIHSFMLLFLLVFVLLINILHSPNKIIPWTGTGFVVTYVLLILAGTLAELTELLSSIAITLDWIQVIANSKQTVQGPTSTELNSVRAKLCLICKIVAPLFWAALFYFSSITASLAALITWTVISAAIELLLLRNMVTSYPDLNSTRTAAGGISGERIDQDQPILSTEPFQIYISQPAFIASIGYALLFMTALVPGALIINYLVYSNALVLEIATLQAIGSGIGIFGSIITPKLIEWVGLSKCGLISVWVYFVLLIVSFVQVVIPGTSVWLLIIPIILSRIFFWTFDLAEKQILKESIDETELAKTLSMEFLVSNLIALLPCAFAIMSITPEKFAFVAGGTLGAVFVGACLFSLWYKKHGHSHQLSTILG